MQTTAFMIAEAPLRHYLQENELFFTNLGGVLESESQKLTFYEKGLMEHLFGLAGTSKYTYEMIGGTWNLDERKVVLASTHHPTVHDLYFNGRYLVTSAKAVEFITYMTYCLKNWEFTFEIISNVEISRQRAPCLLEERIEFYMKKELFRRKKRP